MCLMRSDIISPFDGIDQPFMKEHISFGILSCVQLIIQSAEHTPAILDCKATQIFEILFYNMVNDG